MQELKSIRKKYKRGEKSFYAVDDVSLSVDKGEFASIIGYSGSGKSTLLSIAAGLLKPDSGTVTVNGQNLAQLKDKKLSVFRNERIGYIPQGQSLLTNLTVYDNILLPYSLYKQSSIITKYAEELLCRLGILKLRDSYPISLSGGEKKRVAVARALINQPGLLLADEPTSDLDEKNTGIILELFKEIASTGTSVVTVTHELDTLKYSDTVYRMDNGKIYLR